MFGQDAARNDSSNPPVRDHYAALLWLLHTFRQLKRREGSIFQKYLSAYISHWACLAAIAILGSIKYMGPKTHLNIVDCGVF